ncbi:hypothetical protein ACSQ67_008076 [Phaseolus vulgaris]
MVIHRLELCITMVRLAIEFVMSVAETVVVVQQRTAEPLGSLNRAKQHMLNFFSLWVLMHQTSIDANPNCCKENRCPCFLWVCWSSCFL